MTGAAYIISLSSHNTPVKVFIIPLLIQKQRSQWFKSYSRFTVLEEGQLGFKLSISISKFRALSTRSVSLHFHEADSHHLRKPSVVKGTKAWAF